MSVESAWRVLSKRPGDASVQLSLRADKAEDRHRTLAGRLRDHADEIGEDVNLDAELHLTEDEAFLTEELKQAAKLYKWKLRKAARALDGGE